MLMLMRSHRFKLLWLPECQAVLLISENDIICAPFYTYTLNDKQPTFRSMFYHAVEHCNLDIDALEKSHVPCPKMIKLCEDENIIGTAFYLMNIIEGRVF